MAEWRKKYELKVTDEELKELQKLSASRTTEVRKKERADILLMLAQGKSYSEIQKELNTNAMKISRIKAKFVFGGLDMAMNDLQRSGKPKIIDDEDRVWLKSIACQKPTDVEGGPHQGVWSSSTLAKYIREHCEEAGHPVLRRVSKSSVWRMLESEEIKPQKIRYYLEKKDPDFEEKAKRVLLTYRRVEILCRELQERSEKKPLLEVYLSYDEKPGIQAIGNIHRDRPPIEGHGFIRRDYEYRRHGTVSLLAGIDLLDGMVTGLVREKHTSKEFIEFLQVVDAKYDKRAVITIVLDNHSIHTSKETLKYLATLPNRFKFIFTPVHASWLNLVEAFFSKMTKMSLRGLRVESKSALQDHIEKWIDEVNACPVPFRWHPKNKKYALDEIGTNIN